MTRCSHCTCSIYLLYLFTIETTNSFDLQPDDMRLLPFVAYNIIEWRLAISVEEKNKHSVHIIKSLNFNTQCVIRNIFEFLAVRINKIGFLQKDWNGMSSIGNIRRPLGTSRMPLHLLCDFRARTLFPLSAQGKFSWTYFVHLSTVNSSFF